ncbi:MAG: Gfo/Idh/MocA family oxidoreductase, partial [Ramlibacter sp.]
GAGWVSQHHLAGWALIADQARVVAIADPQAGAAQARANQYGIAHVFDSAQRMFDEARLDAVDIAAPREFHAAIARSAAQKGLAVLCQKPLAPTLAEARALVEEIGESTRLMVHENWRFRPYYRALAQWLRDGRIGEVVQVHASLLTSGLIPDAQGQLPALVRQPFVATLDRALVMEILIHHIDTLRFLLGDMQLCYARLGHASPAMKGEDRAFMVFETQSGAPVSMLSNLAVHGQAPGLVDRLTFIGTRGTAVLDGNKLRCFGDHACELTYDMPACYLQSYAAAIAHFADCLRTGDRFETSAVDNLKTLALVEAAYRQGSAEVR